MTGISPQARLLRGFAIDFLTAHNPAAVEWVMDPAYCLSIGGFVLDGRDATYLPATVAQLDQFPGLCVTVHDVVFGTDALAMRFTEHGISLRNPGRAATWGGITLFRTSGGRLRQGWAEEDYFARKLQLKSGVCDAILAPHPAPWDQPVLPASPATEAAALGWLHDTGTLLKHPGLREICSGGPAFADLIVPAHVTVSTLFSASGRAAFHAVCHGAYAGGFDDVDPALTGHAVALPIAGLVDVDGTGAVGDVQLSADRLGLQRALLDLARAKA